MGKATGPTYTVPFRRRRQSLTNYAKRLALLKSMKPRMVVRKSNRNVLVHFVSYAENGDATVAVANSRELAKFGWHCCGNTPTAYLTGLLAGRRAKEKGVAEFVPDIGLATPSKGAVVFAAIKGAIDAGLKTKYEEGMVDEKRIRGEHVAKYAGSLKGKPEYDKIFSSYLKANIQPENIPAMFDKVKEEIMK
ncbi:50S ribosomal protein L18 [Candidatus Micrarchaeota archaeon]|nr:50S ribosomal protein L18 [Candidatus Micrarchaeota archaeon]